MRSHWLLSFVIPAILIGCGPSPQDEARVQEVKAYLLKLVDAQKRYKSVNQTYSLNMKELTDFDSSLEEPPAGYTVKGGGGLALAFSYELRATPQGSGPHFYVNQSGVVRYSNRGPADERSAPVE
ncbi:MAG: type IV pilin protein, partial [Thermoanaerobaculia bacterium]